MLDTETKRRIDTARDILVGKVPDPKSQVEQITIALIYKFMDDMDAEAEELGGKRKFFKGEFAAYGWAKLVEKAGNEKLRCYADGIARMTENEGLPALFRDIFKNAYLPYRDPETLNAFLKIINEFRYDHSERLGDAFEYLLSVLGSQGDAGQFRTPRHIIDFMVEIVKPQKHETVLDPACGTAGFLISAYKHILRSNRDAKGNSKLTPDDKGKLAKNFKGYDISPDMVRLSLVNLYLHGFTDPHIYEYDSLTQEERWNELADVILANPPFMSPKGGIRPHKRFSIQAKRSEVLFVDYMAEHLTAQGRAGIIVPEGIIFQSQTAYVELRKMLVDTCLVAVISLPAGCFNPYSGVKTSILLLDKALAKQSDTIAFFKVENDGFGLGAQRRAIEQNDLPQVQTELEAYLEALRAENDVSEMQPTTGLIVPKSKVVANGDYNLSGERYSQRTLRSALFPYLPLGEVAVVDWGNTDLTKSSYVETGAYLGVSAAGCDGRMSHAEHDVGTLVLSAIGANCGRMFFPDEEFTAIKNTMTIKPHAERLEPLFLFHLLSKSTFPKRGGGQPFIAKGDVVTLQIPVPPLEVQKEIVAEIEGYQKVIDGARAVLDHYRPHIPIHPDWPMVELPSVARFQEGPGILAKDFRNDGVPLVRLAGLGGDTVTLNGCNFLDREMVAQKWNHFRLCEGDILVSTSASFGRPAIVGPEAAGAVFYTGLIRFHPVDATLDAKYLEAFLGSPEFLKQGEAFATGSSIKHFGPMHLKQMKITLPPLATQRAIVSEIEAEQALVAANRELITRMEAKIQATLARVWGEEAHLQNSL